MSADFADGAKSGRAVARVAWALRLALLLALILVASRLGDLAVHQIDLHRISGGDTLPHRTLMIATITYVVMMALPFCPGIEIGLAMMILLGAKIAPLVYAATVFALLVPFAMGRLVPASAAITLFERLRWLQARDLLMSMQTLDEKQRLAFLLGQTPPRLARRLLEHRYLAIAVALNTPGNILVGDGGGIALAAGLSQLYSFPRFALTVMLAVSPIPIAVMLSAW
jgi:hypothetical protein